MVSLNGGGFRGDYVNRVFPAREHELEYFPPFASCEAVKAAYPTATDVAAFSIAFPEVPAMPLTCDLGFDSGGWTLLSASAGQGASASTETVPVQTGVRGYIPPAMTRLIAEGATRVHVRTQGQANTRSFTTVAGSTPILNLRQARLLDVDPFSINDYQGPITTITRACSPAPARPPSAPSRSSTTRAETPTACTGPKRATGSCRGPPRASSSTCADAPSLTPR